MIALIIGELAEKCLFAPPHEHCCTPTHPPPLRRKLCLTFTFSNLSFPTHNFQKRNYFSLISGSELSVWLCLLWWVCVSVFGKPKSSREPDFEGCSGCLDHFPKGCVLFCPAADSGCSSVLACSTAGQWWCSLSRTVWLWPAAAAAVTVNEQGWPPPCAAARPSHCGHTTTRN